MSEKLSELVKVLGIDPATITDETDVNVLADELRSKQRELVLADKEFIEPIKEQVSKESAIVATKKAKKAFNEKYGLGLSNKELDEMEYSALLDLQYEKGKGAVNEEVNTLQEQIIALTNAKKAAEEAAEVKVSEVEKTWQEKYLSKEREKVIAETVGVLDLIISKEKAAKLLEMEIKAGGYSLVFGEGGVKVMHGEYEAIKPDKTGKMTVNDLAAIALDDFVKKSNGTTDPLKKVVVIDENMNPAIAARLKQIHEKAAMIN